MTIVANALYPGQFTLRGTDSNPSYASSLPTLDLYLDGVLNAAVITIVQTPVTGVYSYSFTTPDAVGAVATIRLNASMPDGSSFVDYETTLGTIEAAPATPPIFTGGVTSYSELQSYIRANLYGRTDLDDEIPQFIKMAERHMSNKLFGRVMETSSDLIILNGSASLPNDFQSVITASLIDTPYTKLAHAPVQVQDAEYPVGGLPQCYDIYGETIELNTEFTGNLRLRYRRNIPNLTDAAPTNWVLEDHDHLYIYGAMFQAFMFIKDEVRANQYAGLFNATINELNQLSVRVQAADLIMQPSVQAV